MKFVRIDNNHIRFTFTVTPEEYTHALEHAFDHIKDDVEVKGFRKGKVTFKVYEQKFGVDALLTDALNHTIGHKFNEALAVQDFVIVSDPSNVDVDIEKVSKDNPFEVSFDVAIKPEVELGEYLGVTVPVFKAEVTDEEVNTEIDSLLKTNATLEPKTEGAIENGDTAIFDFEGFVDGEAFEGGKAENFSLEIGSGQFIPGFEEGMLGLKSGEERDVNVKFPENYQAENLAGKDAVFKVKLHEIKVSKGAELNDDWVKSLDREGVETVEQLKKSIKDNLLATKESQIENDLTDAVLNKIIENAKVDVPKEMIEHEADNFKKNVERQAQQYQLDFKTFLQLSGFTEEAFAEEATRQAERRVLQLLVLEEVAKAEKLGGTDEEVAKRYEELAKQHSMPVEEVKLRVNDAMINQDIGFEKAIKLVVEKAIQK